MSTAPAPQIDQPSLGKTFSQGVAWFYLLRVASQLIGSVQYIIVARFLSPVDFGLMGIASLVLSVLGMLATTGFDKALIQRRDDVAGFLDTVWLVSVARGALLGLIVFLGAPLAGLFFREQAAVPVLRVLCLVPVINGFASPGLIKLSKDLRFRRLVIFDAVRSVLVAIVAITAALVIRSVWALVATSLCGAAVMALGSFFIHPYRPGLGFEWKRARELWRFGRWYLSSRLLHYLFNDGDDWVVGRVLGAQALGFYQVAYRLGCAPSTEVTNVFNDVAFPAFATIQDDLGRLRQAYLRVLQLIMFVSTSMTVGIILVARDAVGILMGEKWLPMVPSLQILVIWGWLRSFRATTGPVLLARGRPDLITKFTFFKVVILAVLIMPLSLRWGIAGTSWAVVVAAFSEVPLLLHSLKSVLQARPTEIVLRIGRPLLPAVPMCVVVLLWQQTVLSARFAVLGLAVSVLLGMVTFLAPAFLLDRRLGWGLGADLRRAAGDNLEPLQAIVRRVLRGKPASSIGS